MLATGTTVHVRAIGIASALTVLPASLQQQLSDALSPDVNVRSIVVTTPSFVHEMLNSMVISYDYQIDLVVQPLYDMGSTDDLDGVVRQAINNVTGADPQSVQDELTAPLTPSAADAASSWFSSLNLSSLIPSSTSVTVIIVGAIVALVVVLVIVKEA